MNSYGRRRVMTALLGFLRGGTKYERVGAARVSYGTGVAEAWNEKYSAGWADLADLMAEWHEALLREFISDEDVDLRRSVARNLSLRAERYPVHLRPLVDEVMRIGRAHPDEWVRRYTECAIRAL